MNYYVVAIVSVVLFFLSLILVPLTWFGSAPVSVIFVLVTALSLVKYIHINPLFLSFRRIYLWMWFGIFLSFISMYASINEVGEGSIFAIVVTSIWQIVTLYLIITYLSPKNVLLSEVEREKKVHFIKVFLKFY
jgi:hypothetical protein